MDVRLFVLVALSARTLHAAPPPWRAVKGDVNAGGWNENCGRVWLTVHAPDLNGLLDLLELNWDFTDCQTLPDKVALYNGEPSDDSVAEATVEWPQGFGVTRASLAAPVPTGLSGPQCLGPWIAALRNGKITNANCLKTQPTWMNDHREVLKNYPLSALVLPGTHNAGSFAFDTEFNSNTRDHFVLCQDRSIYEQLVFGIRYFDFRVGFYDSYEDPDDKYWLNHNILRVRPLLPLLRDFRKFLDSTNEVIILDFHHFPIGFYGTNNAPLFDVHAGLLEMVQRELGSHIIPWNQVGTHPTLGELQDGGRRLIISYVNNAVANANPWLWPKVPHLWAQTNNVNTLFEFLDRTIPNPPFRLHNMHSAMAQTTPAPIDIILGRGSIRINADAVNRNATARLRNQWSHTANIVSTDFFLSDDVVDVAIELNLARTNN